MNQVRRHGGREEGEYNRLQISKPTINTLE